jgi:hypothetical protein
MVGGIAIARQKTSLEIDMEKVKVAREVLKTKTMTETVDAALDEIVRREAGRKLIEILDTPGMLELDDPEVMKGAWRIGGRRSSS